MRVFFDTSVLVAALFEGHAFHRQAFPWLKRAREREFSFLVATHTLAELYSALTSLPVKPKITPGAAQELIHERDVSGGATRRWESASRRSC
jgi:predicted nucleic acid-binding protein